MAQITKRCYSFVVIVKHEIIRKRKEACTRSGQEQLRKYSRHEDSARA